MFKVVDEWYFDISSCFFIFARFGLQILSKATTKFYNIYESSLMWELKVTIVCLRLACFSESLLVQQTFLSDTGPICLTLLKSNQYPFRLLSKNCVYFSFTTPTVINPSNASSFKQSIRPAFHLGICLVSFSQISVPKRCLSFQLCIVVCQSEKVWKVRNVLETCFKIFLWLFRSNSVQKVRKPIRNGIIVRFLYLVLIER